MEGLIDDGMIDLEMDGGDEIDLENNDEEMLFDTGLIIDEDALNDDGEDAAEYFRNEKEGIDGMNDDTPIEETMLDAEDSTVTFGKFMTLVAISF